MKRGGTTGLSRIGNAGLWLVLGACNGDTPTPPATPVEPDRTVSTIRVLPSERTIGVLGTEFSVGAAALAEDGTVLYGSTLDPGRFSWSSSAPDVATLDEETLLVTGVSEGTATITATSQDLSGSMTIDVRDRTRLAWSVPAGTGAIQAGVSVGSDGTIFVGTNDHAAGRSLWYAVSPQGGVRWILDLPPTGRSTPAMGADGTLYLGSWSDGGRSGSLVAVDPGGTVRWVLDGIDAIWSSPALGPDGTIYVAGGRHVHAVDPQGQIQWIYEAAGADFTFSSPAVAKDGTIYVGGDDRRLHAINVDGSPRWMFKAGDLIQSSPAIGTDGTIYFGSEDGLLYAVHPDGTARWSVEIDFRGVVSSPSIGSDGTIYIGGDGVFAIEPGGSILWHFPGSQVGNTPILGADGNVYVGAAGGVTALDAQGRLLWDYDLGGTTSGSPAIGGDGMIIAASFARDFSSGTIHALVETESSNGGFEGAPWPQTRGNRNNTGRAGG